MLEIFKKPLGAAGSAEAGLYADISHSSISKWLDGLPLINLSRSSRLIYGGLVYLREHHPADVHTYAKLLSLFWLPLNNIYSSILENYLQKDGISSQKKANIYSLLLTVQFEYIAGYELIIDKLKLDNKENGKELLAHSLHSALYLLSGVVYEAIHLYYNVPEQVWQKIHKIYQLAHEKNLTEYRPEDMHHFSGEQLDTLTLYKRILLFATANLYRLQRHDISKIYALLSGWAKKLSLSSIMTRAAEGDLYIVLLNSDQGPIYRKLVSTEEGKEKCLIMHTTALQTYLNELIKLSRVENNNESAPFAATNLLKHLLKAWSEVVERASPRIQAEGNMHICIGLASAHYFINGQQQLLPSASFENSEYMLQAGGDLHLLPQSAIEHSHVYQAQHEINQDSIDPWLSVYKQKSVNPEGDISAEKIKLEAGYEIQEWKIINISTNGFGLMVNTLLTERIKVSEVVGLLKQENGESIWHIGVIRWFKATNDNVSFMGVELIGLNPIPVTLSLNSHKGESNLAGLVLCNSNNETDEFKTSLILHNLAYQVGDRLKMDKQGTSMEIKLEKLINVERHYKQFLFKIILDS